MNASLAGLVFLIIGDSHISTSSYFNNALHDGLRAQGAIVHSYGVCASTPEDWLRPLTFSCGGGERQDSGPAKLISQGTQPWAITGLMAQHHPDIVVVELGDTIAQYASAPTLPRDEVTREVKYLTNAISARNVPCIWIGPAWGTEGGPYKKTFSRVKELSDLLARSVAPCHYIDSLTFSRPGEWPTKDGVHLTASAYPIWAGKLVDSIDRIAPEIRKH
jgi:hypothetical protein